MARLRDLVIDCAHPARLARFWAAALDGHAVAPYDDVELARLRSIGVLDVDDDPTVLVEPNGDGPRLWFQRVPEQRSGKNRMHLDLVADDPRREVDRLVALGAWAAEAQPNGALVVMHDPEGNEFCVLLVVELAGGVANAGAVTRVGDHVLRPSNPNTPTIHRFLRSLDEAGFDGASVPLGVDVDGRERLQFIDGDVPIVPYPEWAQTDAALASIARLLRRFHEAAGSFATGIDDTWSDEMADPDLGVADLGVPGCGVGVCHNDVCLENVVFRDGEAIALLDFDFAAPGRRLYDLACFARMCVPIDDDSRFRLGWRAADQPARLRVVADAYGLDGRQRGELVELVSGTIERGGEFIRRRVEAGDRNFTAMWTSMGGMARFDRRRAWWVTARPLFDDAMR